MGFPGANIYNPPTTYIPNGLINSAFDYWQEKITSGALTNTGVPAQTGADGWFHLNNTGTTTAITTSQVAGSKDGSTYGLQCKVTTGGTGGANFRLQVGQMLSNKASMIYYNQPVTVGFWCKALGNITAIDIWQYAKTSEALPTIGTTAGPRVTVNSATFTYCQATFAATTAQTASGCLGLGIAMATVSSGTLTDLNNGIIIEQVQWNLGTQLMPYARQYSDPVMELSACQYFYEKSYDVATLPAAATQVGAAVSGQTPASVWGYMYIPYKVNKRIVPTFSFWDAAGNASKMTFATDAGNAKTNNLAGFQATQGPGTFGTGVGFITTTFGASGMGILQWVADARMS